MSELDSIVWTSSEVAQITSGRLIGPPWEVSGLAIDSRHVRAGDLFFALPGSRDHGERYISHAFSRGAVAAVATDYAGELPENSSFLFVDNVEMALTALAQEARTRMIGTVIAVTGSSGKTSTREMIAAVGEILGVCHQSPASYNNFRGVPFSLASMPTDTDLGVFEVGMNHSGEIAPLSKLLAPDCAVITSIGEAHIGHLGSQEAIAHAKAEIFLGLSGRKLCILPGDDQMSDTLYTLAREAGCSNILRFGQGNKGFEANLIGVQQTLGGKDQLPCSTIRADILGRTITWTLPIPGAHMARNSLAALLSVASLSGNPDRETLTAAAHNLSRLSLPSGRGKAQRLQLQDGGQIIVIDDSYNANPQSVHAAIDVLGTCYGRGRRIAVLGDMQELGDAAERLHTGLLEVIDTGRIDKVYSCGPLMATLMANLPKHIYGDWAPTSEALVEMLLPTIQDGDILLIKGSLSMNMARILSAIKDLEAVQPDYKDQEI